MLLTVSIIFALLILATFVGAAVDEAFSFGMTARQRWWYGVIMAGFLWPVLLALEIGQAIGRRIAAWRRS